MSNDIEKHILIHLECNRTLADRNSAHKNDRKIRSNNFASIKNLKKKKKKIKLASTQLIQRLNKVIYSVDRVSSSSRRWSDEEQNYKMHEVAGQQIPIKI